ncbi:hypothetical protein QWZ16_21280 [Vibrio ostreicida]|uniref:DUF3265 domain-containing protein n=1 Tax=Vibrio ostreicida TaxID=526588 RepID=A0ABT8C196_9VIBR|nr:hypothetical protein [Vibrio ostreicida]MDN3612130.1 hypothetical protein [Vibrio ostreicida]
MPQCCVLSAMLAKKSPHAAAGKGTAFQLQWMCRLQYGSGRWHGLIGVSDE